MELPKFIKRGAEALAVVGALSGAPTEKAEAAANQQPTCNIETVGQEGETRRDQYEKIVQEIAEDPTRFKIKLLEQHITLAQKAHQPQVDKWKSVDTTKDRPDSNWKKVFDDAQRATEAGMSTLADFNFTEEMLSQFNEKEADRLNTLQKEMQTLKATQKKLEEERAKTPIDPKKIEQLEVERALSESAINALTRTLARALQTACEAPTSR